MRLFYFGGIWIKPPTRNNVHLQHNLVMEDLHLRKLRLIEFILQEHDVDSIARLEELAHRIDYDEDSKTKIIGFRTNGMAVIKSDFLAAIEKSVQEVNAGKFLTFDELVTESENW